MGSQLEEDIEKKANRIASELFKKGRDKTVLSLIDKAFDKTKPVMNHALGGSKATESLRNELADACIEAHLIFAHTRELYGADSAASVAMLFWRLGYVQSLYEQMPKYIDQLVEQDIEASNRKLSDAKRMAGLQTQNQSRAMVREFAANVAARLWERESTKSQRIGDMCDSVWSILTELFHTSPKLKPLLNYLPDKATGLRQWIKPVAPKHAKRRGRPKKI